MSQLTETEATAIEEPSIDSRYLQSIMSSSFPITLKFMEVSYKVNLDTTKSSTHNLKNMLINASGPTSQDPETSTVKIRERKILDGITGMAHPGEILAVLGPSGSGKSTLLNALSGRLQSQNLTGTILTNDGKFTRNIFRRTGFVPQEDVLYPHLTVKETLIFCSLLKLPLSLNKGEKIMAAEWVISELGLSKCAKTIIGNNVLRGISGGERKRVSIAHEMLMNPSLLILDEPTSGLDSTAAFRLVSTLETVVARKGKTVVMSVHQPSSMVYQMFDKVVVLSEGRCLYYGKGNEAMRYFESIGFWPSFPMNPADFLLDLANGVCQLRNNGKDNTNVKQTLISSYNTLLAPKVMSACKEKAHAAPPELMVKVHSSREHRCTCGNYVSNWLNQFSILLERSLKERRHESFNSLRVFQVIAAALLAGSIWWHSDFRNIQDRLGLLFFIAIFWGVLPSFSASFAFPQERAMFMKERASSMYTLSSYFMARVIGDIPMELMLPIVFMTITYWMAELKPEFSAFVLTLMIILGYVLVSQGLGLALGALIMDAKQASTVVTVTMLAFVLAGGFYVHKMPYCLGWIKYISMTFYAYRLLINVQYGDGTRISSLMGCIRVGNDNPSCRLIQEDIEGQIPPFMSAGILLIMFVGYRLIAYLALRCIR